MLFKSTDSALTSAGLVLSGFAVGGLMAYSKTISSLPFGRSFKSLGT